jgi:RNA polymerase sigma-70 factor (ECF subfamily)
VLNGCKDDFAVLVGRYNFRIHRYAASKMLDRASVDDVVQKSFVTAFQQLAGYDPRWPFEDWLRGIVRNHCRNEWRQHLRRVRATGKLLEIKRAEWEIESLGREDLAEDRLDALRECLQKLGDFDRRILLTRFVEQAPIKTISERFGLSGPAARELLFRLRLRLAECVRKRLGLERKEET